MTKPESGDALVLVVEDYQDAREMYSAYLQFSGYRVEEATNGMEAIEKAIELTPDIILMDLALPKVDGWEATKRLKSDPRTKHIPIVALTGHALAGFAGGGDSADAEQDSSTGRQTRQRTIRTTTLERTPGAGRHG